MKTSFQRGRPLLAAIIALALIAAGCSDDDDQVSSDEWPDRLRMAFVASTDTVGIDELYGPFAELLEEELGVEIELLFASDYAGVIEATIAGDADIVGFGAFPYVLATMNEAPIEAIAVGVGGPNEEPGYTSVLSARADRDDLETIEDTVGLQVCFVDPASTSGYLVPSAGYLELGIDPENDITPTFAGGHENSVLSVRDGHCDAGFSNAATPDQVLIDQGEISEGDLKRLWESGMIMNALIAVNTNLPQDLRDAIRAALLVVNGETIYERTGCEDHLETPEGVPYCPLTTQSGGWGYIAVTDDAYDPIRELCDLTQAPACQS